MTCHFNSENRIVQKLKQLKPSDKGHEISINGKKHDPVNIAVQIIHYQTHDREFIFVYVETQNRHRP